MNNSKIDFLYLNEEDMIRAGVLDMPGCICAMEDAFELLGKGDYVCGGMDRNRHGITLSFPDDPVGLMPKNGPDRRFSGMSAYVGGNYDVCGMKWYGSNKENQKKELPRSVAMMILNDKSSGAPIALMSASILSGMRTGAVMGLGAKRLADPESRVLSVIGPGVVNNYAVRAYMETMKHLETVIIYGTDMDDSRKFAEFVNSTYPRVNAVIVSDLKDAVKNADIISAAVSGYAPEPHFTKDMLKEGSLLISMSAVSADSELALSSNCVVDNWKMYPEEAKTIDRPCFRSNNNLGFLFLDMVENGKMNISEIINLYDTDKLSSKAFDRSRTTLLSLYGIAVEDVIWGYQVYCSAKKDGIGQILNLWDTPANI